MSNPITKEEAAKFAKNFSEHKAPQESVSPCPSCEYHRKRAQLWRDEAYRQAGHPLPEQEPVAWISPKELLVMRGNAYAGAKDWRVNLGLEPEEGDVGLYTTPPQRTWVGLTDEDCDEVERWVEFKEEFSSRIPNLKLIRYIEAKLKEKNYG